MDKEIGHKPNSRCKGILVGGHNEIFMWGIDCPLCDLIIKNKGLTEENEKLRKMNMEQSLIIFRDKKT